MTEYTPEHQDPAEQYETGTEVETEPEAPEPTEPEAVAVAVEPAETPTNAPGLLDQFEVTAERGHRLKG